MVAYVSVSEPIAGCARADVNDLFVNEYLVKIQFIYVVESIIYVLPLSYLHK